MKRRLFNILSVMSLLVFLAMEADVFAFMFFPDVAVRLPYVMSLVTSIYSLLFGGIAGIFVDAIWARVLLWILSIPPLYLGTLILWQGGFVEPFSLGEQIAFCSLLFLPVLGCTIGQFRRHYARGMVSHKRSGICVKCGYDLRASKERCPECGTPIPVQTASEKV